MKYKPKRDLPKFALQYHTDSPTELAKIVLKERNKAITPESITMWFKRHPQIYEQILKDIHKEELPALEVSETIFANGTFEELPSVKKWIQEMEDRVLSRGEIQNRLSALKRCCRGHGLSAEEWNPKHPDRLTLDEAREYVRKRMKQGFSLNKTRIALRDFLPSKGKAVGKKISGAKESGKYSKLYLPPEIAREYLEEMKLFNFQCYAVNLMEIKTGTRINAILDSRIENINEAERYITVYDKGRRSKYPKGHPWDKHLDTELWSALEKLIGDRAEGNIFTIGTDEVRKLNKVILRGLIKKYVKQPKLVRLLKMCLKQPTHWLRHQFFQHCLHMTDWKYGVCAALGGSTVKSLEESYGQPPKAIVKEWGEEWLEKITI